MRNSNHYTAVAALAAAAVLFMSIFSSCGKETDPALVIYNTETGKEYCRFDVTDGDEFSVEFIHSVNLSPVKDVFVVRDGKIVANRTVYSTFGAGVQTEVEEGQTLSYDDKGNMIVSGFDTVFPEVKYIVGTVYDHVLEIGTECISLTEMCGKNAHIAFVLR